MWGCDKPAPSPVFAVTCAACGGRLEDCPRCEGVGEVGLDRCATHYRKTEPLVGEFMVAWSAWRAHGVLPGPGGLYDQTRTWVQLCAIADGEAAKLRKRDDRDRTEAGEAEARRRALMGR